MFVYKVKSPDSLISYVTISGQYLTLWQRADYGAEIGTFRENNSDLLEVVKFAEDTRHEIFHSDGGFTKDHVHLIVKKEMSEETLAELLQRIKLASTKEGRQQEYETCCQILETGRIEAGHQELPLWIKEKIERFDKTSPHLAEKDIESLMKSFQEYFRHSKTSKYIFQTHHDKTMALLCELWVSVLSGGRESEKKWKTELETLNKLRLLLKGSSIFTTTFGITAIEEIIAKFDNGKIKEMDEMLNERKRYPLPRLSEYFQALKQDLAQIKKLLQASWYKRIFNVATLPIVYVAIRFGFSILGGGLIGLSAWTGADVINRARDWYKFNSYQTLRSSVAELNVLQHQSIEAGVSAADSVGQQILACFNKATWMYPQEYYGAMASRQLKDEELLLKLKRPSC